MRENLSSVFANSKGTDQPAHPRRLISTIVFRFLESIICKLCKLNTCEVSGFKLALTETPKTGFHAARPNNGGLVDSAIRL